MTPWKILVVDDEEGIHGITRMIFRDYEFEQRPIELISAMNGEQARTILTQHPDIALVLLDVVMETENEGLQLVEYIRNDLHNQDVRIILRTGHPGYAPEAQVIIQYDINDYLSKAELSASRLLTSVVVGLRSWRDIRQAHESVHADGQTESPLSGALLQAVAQQVKQQLSPMMKNGQRLLNLDLNPVAKDLAATLHSQHLRLDHIHTLLEQRSHNGLTPQTCSPAHILNQLLQIFLPQSRSDGWLIDYRLDASVPDALPFSEHFLQSVLITATELVLLQSNGNDLKIALECPDKALLIIRAGLSAGQPVFDRSPWAEFLRSALQEDCESVSGRLTEVDEGALVELQFPVRWS